jgi:hypothetical protein
VFRPLSDAILSAALWVGVGAFALTLLMTIAIFSLRFHWEREERRWQDFVTRWRPPLLVTILDSDPATLPALAPGEGVMFLRLWAYLHESVRGAAVWKLNQVALELGMDAAARRLLANGNRTQRLHAVLAAAHLRDAAAWDALEGIADSRDGLLAVNAARALVRIDPARAAERLVPRMLVRQDWDLNRIGAFLGEAREPFWRVLAEALPRLPMDQQLRALSLSEALKVQFPDETMRELLHADRPADLLRAALRLTGNLALAEEVRRCLDHADASVRAEAVNRMAHVAVADDLPRLAALLDDEAWAVRMATAQVLRRLPFVSREMLEDLRARHPRSQDVLTHTLAEMELG